MKMWIAQMIQYPEIKSVCPVLISEDGAGKNTILEFLKRMLGEKKVMETTKPQDEVCGHFNSKMQDAFLLTPTRDFTLEI